MQLNTKLKTIPLALASLLCASSVWAADEPALAKKPLPEKNVCRPGSQAARSYPATGQHEQAAERAAGQTGSVSANQQSGSAGRCVFARC